MLLAGVLRGKSPLQWESNFSSVFMQGGTEQTYDVTQHGKSQPKLAIPDPNYEQLEHVSTNSMSSEDLRIDFIAIRIL